MTTLTLEIDPSRRILTGAAAGRSIRQELGLDKVDRSDQSAVVRISTPVVTASFIRGLLGDSVRSLGVAAFWKKYRFEASPGVRESIVANASDALEDAAD